uniref:RGS domain-containing protein n=1 Tax=Esox lucius TaxID=8010 RepID=A0A3P8ZFX8_ESOLU
MRVYEFKDMLQNRKHKRVSSIICMEKLAFKKPHSDFSTLIPEGCFAAFRVFLQSEFSEENIEFWLACQEYRKTPSTAERSWKATKIFQDFLHPQAQRSIRIKIRRAMKAPCPCCFDEAVIHMYKLMERDSFPRFLRSDCYPGLRQEAGTPW